MLQGLPAVKYAYYAAIVASSTTFLFYGIACLSFEGMKRDFERFNLSRLRILPGALVVLGALGLIVGQRWPPLVPLSAGGLALMMLDAKPTRLILTAFHIARDCAGWNLLLMNKPGIGI